MVEKIMAYCVRCKSKQPMKNYSEFTTKNNRKIIKGLCDKCGCKMCKFIGGKA